MYLIWGCACGRQQSRQTHEPAQHAPQPRNQASPSPTAVQDPRFQAPAGCRQAHTGQPSHLATGSHSWRARRPDTARRPGAEAFAHSFAIPLHLNHPALDPGSVPARSSPQMRQKAALWPPALPISAREARHLAQVATADLVHLHNSDAEVVAAYYAKGAMGRGPEDSAAPATASLAAARQQKPKTVSGG